MTQTYNLTATPCRIDLGRHARAEVISAVPFLHDTTQHCADTLHVIEGGHRREAVLQALNPAREGHIRVWRK
jgi:hypothetical protein